MNKPNLLMNSKDQFIRHLLHSKPLTICIAGICEAETSSPKIVFCADRLITSQIVFEHGQSKIQRMTDYCYVMVSSNDSLKSDLIVKTVQNKIAGRRLTIREIVELVARECDALKTLERERSVLSNFGLTYETFNRQSRELSEVLIRQITNYLMTWRYEFESEFLIFGLEPAPHIYVVNQDGEYKLDDFLGFATIGSGAPLAFSEMTKYVYYSNVTLSNALVRVYNAKKVAERVGSVGRFTDLYVLHIIDTERGEKVIAPWEVVPDAIKELDEGLRKMKQNEESIYVDIMTNLGKFFRQAQEPEEELKQKQDDSKSKDPTDTTKN